MCSEAVYISDIVMVSPAFASLQELGDKWKEVIHAPSPLPETDDPYSVDTAKLMSLSLSEKNSKAMRKEVLASLILCENLLGRDSFSHMDRAAMSLYLATGLSFEGYADQINTITSTFLENSDEDAAHAMLYKRIHPLFALKTLTNASVCHIAQALGIRGRNATIGSTSYAGLQVIKEGCKELQKRGAEIALVGTANETALFSNESFGGIVPPGSYITGSDCFVFYLLETENSLEKRGVDPLCRIKKMECDASVADLFCEQGVSQEKELQFYKNHRESEKVLFSAPYDTGWDGVPTTHGDGLIHTHKGFGNFGVSSLLFSGALGASLISAGETKSVDCFDIDCYGRLSALSLEAIK